MIIAAAVMSTGRKRPEPASHAARMGSRPSYYLSLEFLMGRLFSNSLYNAGVIHNMVHALEELGLDYEELREESTTWGSAMAVLAVLRRASSTRWRRSIYQASTTESITNTDSSSRNSLMRYQVELPDAWMQYGTPWEIVRSEQITKIQVYGYVENVFDDRGNYVPR
jgi:glycogen phosphorylase